MSCLSDGDIERWRERNEKISIKYLEFLRGWRDKGEGREEGARRVVFQFGAILFVGDRWVLAVQKKRVFYVGMRVNDDCFVHSDVI